MELDYDYIAKLVRKTQEGDSDAFAENHNHRLSRWFALTL